MKRDRQRPKKHVCRLCGYVGQTHIHHIFGGRWRRISERYNFVIELCPRCHEQAHNDAAFARTLKHIFLGGEFFEASTLKLYTHGGTTPKTEGTDYSYTYSNGLLDIELISSGSLYSESTVDVEIVVEQAGCVEITPICYGGEVPSASLLQAVLESCSAPDVKPLTDRVSVKAPDVIYYDIEIEYYTTEAEESACVASVEGDGGAIDRYNYWQGSSLNRDLNPDYLRKLILAPDWEGSVAATMVNVVKPVYQDLPATTIAKFSGNKTVTHVVREGVN